MSTPPGQATPPGSLNQQQAQAYAQQQQDMALSGSSSGGTLSDSSIIYFGYGAPSLEGNRGDVGHGLQNPLPGGQSNQMKYQDARLVPLSWTPAQLKKFVNQGILYKNPDFNTNMGMPEIISAWDNLVKASFEFNKSDVGGQKWTPQDVMDSYAGQKGQYGTIKQGDWMVDAQTGERVKYVGPTSQTTTNKSVNLSSSQDVQALTTQVLTQALGRAPTAKEVATYKSTLNAAEKANPQVTTTTSQLIPDASTGNVTQGNQTSTTSGGLSAAAEQQMVMSNAQQTPEYAKYQAGTTYFNALLQLIGGSG